jgi:DeoR/GlpR family transcriptional regulator of sugar metabolism
MSVSNALRREKIREYLAQHHEASVQDLSEHLNASEATIRRDIQALSREQGFTRSRGGIGLDESKSELSVLQRGRLMADRKRLIGREAAALVRDGESIFLGSGSTTIEVARCLSGHRDLTVITNSLPIITALVDDPRITLVVTGGAMRRPELSFIGHIVEKALSELRADMVIMGIQGIHPEHGLTNEFLPEAILDRSLVRFAPRLCIVADSSKLGKIKASFVGDIRDVDVLVTDGVENAETLGEIGRCGVRTVVAGSPAE